VILICELHIISANYLEYIESFMAAALAVGLPGPRAREFVDWIDPRPVAEQISSATDLIPDVAAIAAQYIGIGVFGPNFWQSKGINAGAVRPIDPAFYDYWFGLDPVDPALRVCDTHHWPVWIPEGLNLAKVEKAGLRFNPHHTTALQQHRNTTTSNGYYAVMRKEVLGRNLTEVKQIQKLKEAGYPNLAQAVDVAAVLFAINQYDGSRWFGNNTGEKTRLTFTRCAERVAFDKTSHALVVGGSASSSVSVSHNRDCSYRSLGVAALRKF
jgi:hypothetical protein